MIPSLRAALLALALLGTAALPATAQQSPGGGEAARSPSPAQAAQQDRMRACNAQATERSLTGDVRRAFMSDCLASRSPAATAAPAQAPAAPSPPPAGTATTPQAAQQDRMRACNAQAGERGLAGDPRRAFMSDCLAGRGPAAAAPPRAN